MRVIKRRRRTGADKFFGADENFFTACIIIKTGERMLYHLCLFSGFISRTLSLAFRFSRFTAAGK